jgi:hypothetical protein
LFAPCRGDSFVAAHASPQLIRLERQLGLRRQEALASQRELTHSVLKAQELNGRTKTVTRRPRDQQ